MRRPTMLLLTLVLAAAAPAADRPSWPGLEPPALLHAIDEHDGSLIFKPWDLAFGPDDRTYVLCTGDSRVVVFDGDWRAAGAFGGAGGGPGEFEMASCLVVAGEEVRIFQPYRQTVFDRDGAWLRTDRMDVWVLDAVAVAGEVRAVISDADRLGAALDAHGALRGVFGPTNPHTDPAARMERSQWGIAWHLLPWDGGLQLLDSMEGVWYRDPEAATVLADLGAVLGRGWSRIEVDEDDETTTVNTTIWTPLSGAALDPHGRLWTCAREHGMLCVEADVPPRLGALRAGRYAVSPRGELVILGYQAGEVKVYALPE